MPRLLLFAPCQRAIIDKSDSSISLIAVLHGLTVNALGEASGEPIPPNAVIPMNWSIGTIWLRSPEDGEKTFEQRVDIITPDNSRVEASPQPFQMTHRTHHLAVAANVFPVGVAGEYRVVLMLREVRENAEWTQVAEFPIEIKHAQNQPQEAGS